MDILSSLPITAPPQSQPTALVPTPAPGSSTGSVFGAVLDAINPLQHIPVVSSLYRAAQGTSISSVSQVVGDTLYGGVIGGAVSSLIASVADVAVKETTGTGMGEHVLATLGSIGSNTSTPSTTATSTMVATALIPASPASSVPTSGTTVTPAQKSLQNQVNNAVTNILHPGLHPEKVAAQYQRAQTLDIANKLLVNAI